MARRPRKDEPGSWHHVINRGIARRTLFERRDDVRFFLARIAGEVRRGSLRVHAFCVLPTHFHFLVESPRGELSDAFRRAQNAYARYFNRTRRRDGALVRGRFLSKRVDDARYRRTLVRYIDQNPVQARIVAHAADHEFSSAHHFVTGRRTPWLERRWVEAEVCRLTGAGSFGPEAYERAFAPPGRCLVELVERRLATPCDAEPLSDLFGSTPLAVRRWMGAKAQLADGTTPGQPVCTLGAIRASLARSEDAESGLRAMLEIGLARDLAGLGWRELSEQVDPSVARLRRTAERHRARIATDEDYARRAAEVARRAMMASLDL
jgi:REP element-mobilizing transposase RayT